VLIRRKKEKKAIELTTEQQIWQSLTDGAPVVLTSHERLDGDGLGSALALWHALRDYKVPCYQVYEPPLPAVFGFLPGVEEARQDCGDLPERFILVVVDCTSLSRTGAIAQELSGKGKVINIDHHLTNEFFGDLNLVRHTASSCGELAYGILEQAGVPISPQIAECLYAAILTDTGRFSFHNTTAEALRICGELVRAGADPATLSEKIYSSPSAAQVMLQGMVMETLRLAEGGKVAIMKITEEMFRRTGVGPVDTQGFADLPACIKGVQVGVLLKEMPGCDFIKVSLRSRDQVDVCEVARHFAGGGHVHAAGCEVKSSIEQTEKAVLEVIRSQLPHSAES